METLLYSVLALVAFVAVVCIVNKLIRWGISLLVACVLVFASYTVVFGDGGGYVDFVCNFLPQERAHHLQTWYAEYQERESANPVVEIQDDWLSGVTNEFQSYYH